MPEKKSRASNWDRVKRAVGRACKKKEKKLSDAAPTVGMQSCKVMGKKNGKTAFEKKLIHASQMPLTRLPQGDSLKKKGGGGGGGPLEQREAGPLGIPTRKETLTSAHVCHHSRF